MDHLRDLLDERDITQKELANRTGIDESHVSRSLRCEREASYQKVYQMWSVLKEDKAEDVETARDVMQPEIAWAAPDDTVAEVGRRAIENQYTQFPVREDGAMIGWITTEQLGSENSGESIRSLVKHEPFMSVPPFVDVESLKEQFSEGTRAILVEESGDYVGIITPHDLVVHTVGSGD